VNDELRELRWKFRQLCRQSGRQGDTIHRLRAELAETRALNSKIDRGSLYRLERRVIDQAEIIRRLTDETTRLYEKLAAQPEVAS
jgi:hypothetical protein